MAFHVSALNLTRPITVVADVLLAYMDPQASSNTAKCVGRWGWQFLTHGSATLASE